MNKTEHTNLTFEEFMNGYYPGECPAEGIYSYVDGKVVCSVHNESLGGE